MPGEQYDFFTQLHDAAKAGPHTDVRIGSSETGLYSWASRHGLPLPGEKRLGIQQPVHRHDYGSWEGTIPAGKYGAGTVRRGEQGKVLITRVEPDAIHFTRTDKKHPERYVMFKPRGASYRQRDWLITNSTPTAASALPYQKIHYQSVPQEQVEDTLAKLDPAASVQAKIDGASSLVSLLHDGADVLSYRTAKATGAPISHAERFWHGRPRTEIPSQLRGSVLRGELYGVRSDEQGNETVIPPHELGGVLNATVANSLAMQKAKNIQLRNALFDVQQVGKHPVDFNTVPYAQRRKMLEEILPHLPGAAEGRFHLAPQARDAEDAKLLWKQIGAGLYPQTREGIVIHNPTGRPMKAKFLDENDVHIAGFFPGQGRRANTVGGFEYALQPGGPVVGRVGTGFSDEDLADMAANPDSWIGRIARVRSQGSFPVSGALRAPAFLARHEG